MSRGHHSRCNTCGTRLQNGPKGLLCPAEGYARNAGPSGHGAPVWPFTARYFGLKGKK